MNWRIFRVLWCSVLVATGLSAASLESLQQAFMSRYDEANLERDQQSKRLEGSYLAALDREMEKAKASGKLESVIPYRDEIAAIKGGKRPLPGLPDNASYGFKQMRKKYVDAHDKIIKAHAESLTELADKMDAALESKEEKLTRAGEIEEALAAKRMRETLAEDVGIESARILIDQDNGFGNDPEEGWASLIKSKMKLLKSNEFPVGWLDEALRPRVSKPVLAAMDGESAGEAVFVSVPPAVVEFETRVPVTEFRARVFLASEIGDVEFRVLVNGKKVASKKLAGKVGGADIACRFKAAERLTLVVDENGSQNSDWAIWIDPQVR